MSNKTTSPDTGDLALKPVPPCYRPEDHHLAEGRLWQGIPSIERAPSGRLWATWYSGGESEGPDNFALLVTSGDNGHTWSTPKIVIDPPDVVRAYDPCLWLDPTGRLWWTWAQSYSWFDGRCGVWAMTTDQPDDPDASWTEPRRLCNGIMMNKPTVLSSGEWLFPAAIWTSRDIKLPEMASEMYSNVYVTTDEGKTFEHRGGADVPDSLFDEHMVVQRRDGSLWMLVRTHTGLAESTSTDGGRTWSASRTSPIKNPSSRFFIRRLASGRLLLVNHHNFEGRSHLSALLSDDDGHTWPHALLLDERSPVSYPDGTQAEDGRITIIYDRDRTGAAEILLAEFREEDIEAGRPVSNDCKLKHVISALNRPPKETD
ncbi:MAG: sialidase family protein [Planctomycetota bacterium]